MASISIPTPEEIRTFAQDKERFFRDTVGPELTKFLKENASKLAAGDQVDFEKTASSFSVVPRKWKRHKDEIRKLISEAGYYVVDIESPEDRSPVWHYMIRLRIWLPTEKDKSYSISDMYAPITSKEWRSAMTDIEKRIQNSINFELFGNYYSPYRRWISDT